MVGVTATTSSLVAGGDEFADCERRNNSFLEQDVNAWSSLAYLAVGIVIAVEVRRARLPRAVHAFALVTALEGVGSLLYHGHASDLSQALHDIPLIAMLAFIAGWHVGRLVDRREQLALAGLTIGVAAGVVTFVALPGATDAMVGMLVGVIVIAEVLARRRSMAAVWRLPILLFGAIAVGFWLLGTPDSPACDADSWFQPHAVWHVATAVIALAWVDLAYAAVRPDRPPLIFRRGTDRVIGVLAMVLTHAFHRSVGVTGREHMPADRPVLVVANHGNGFVDPIVVAAALRRLPRFLAKAALWKVAVARPFLALAGVLPVYRSADGDRSSDNRSIFEACHRDLAQGSTVAIFPEGTTGDRAGLDRVRSGAARIALGALATAPDLAIVPVGLAFESRVETRSRTVVMFGDPIEVAPFATSTTSAGDAADEASGREDVVRLTGAIEAGLEAVSPSFASVDEREILRASARVERDDACRHGAAGFGDVELVARRLAGADDATRAAVVDRYRAYATRLTLVGLSERQVHAARTPWWRLALSAVTIVIAGPLLLTVTLIHLPALAVVVVGTALVRSTATKGTVRLLLGLVTGLATWIIAGVVIADGTGALLAAIAVAVGGACALVVWPPIVRAADGLVGRWTVRDRGSLMNAIGTDRDALIETVRDASMRP